MSPESLPASPRIEALRAELERGNGEAVVEFWRMVANDGAPLVDRVDGDDAHVLVTFLWRGSAATRNVRVLGDDILPADAAENAMARLAGSDVWYKTYRLHAELRFEYLLAQNDAELLGATADTWQERTATWQPDPLNARQYVLPDDGEHPEWEEYFGSSSTWVRRLNSLVELPAAPPQPWVARRTGVAVGDVEKHRFKSAILGNARALYVYTSPGYQAAAGAHDLLVLLDGWLYAQIIPTPTILDNLLADGAIRPLVAVIIDHPSFPDRERELSLDNVDPPIVEFLAEELLPWVRAHYGVTRDPARTVVGGASDSGNIAAVAALLHPELFGNVLSQSGSFGQRPEGDPEPEWVARRIAEGPTTPLRFHIDVGALETTPGKQSGLSVLQANRHVRTVVRAKGYPLHYVEFAGGHQPLCWQGTLGDGLASLTPAGGDN